MLKKSIGFCRCDTLTPVLVLEENIDSPGEGVGDGAENKSRGNPELVILELAIAEEDEDPDTAALSDGRERPPSPDIGASSSAKASNEIRSAAFLFGLCLRIN